MSVLVFVKLAFSSLETIVWPTLNKAVNKINKWNLQSQVIPITDHHFLWAFLAGQSNKYGMVEFLLFALDRPIRLYGIKIKYTD